MQQPDGTQLAQFNWATLRHHPNDPRVAEFMDNVARMNQLAERLPGFVWRHLDDRKALRKLGRPGLFAPRPRFTTTLSVWRSVEDLRRFAFQTVHDRFYVKRAEWFEPPAGPYMVMWWVPEGARPTIPEAVAKAEALLRDGASPDAFGWESVGGKRQAA